MRRNRPFRSGLARRALLGAAGALAMALAPLPSLAQEGYPNKPIRVIVPFAAGGTTDLIARLVGGEMSRRLGQPLVVDNRAGAGGNIGAEACARAPADGYTLCMGTISSHAINASIYPRIPFDNLRDFAPLALLGSQPNLLVVANNIQARTVPELIALMKARPGVINYGSSGVGTSIHLAGELFTQLTGTTAVHVPYRSSGQIMTDMLSGQLPMAFDNFSSAWPHAKEGRIRALGVGSLNRVPQAPDVPTIAETLPGFESVSWHGLFAPAATPRPIVDRLNREALAAIGTPEIRARYEELGITANTMSPDAFRDFVAEQTRRWGEVARRANIQVE
ncbi:tripartite tricarboxylate transporter substrate binding protein [Roseomonas sp. KE2513]|uniref:Bug family tripartite tricarboxylate transporter substrate binding protein n=1 Tax=Roseomonas sp. KE2513 TaxID=2479202 RepID=UPI0018DF80AE|nr:tripartite tricarboxylate transporter substrate binding protein [Roseomonas sp. KE2513]MBI0538097.1 tripartite tricarboxylate transporter substrate binding protein [Roseomonas sp. KE2513]